MADNPEILRLWVPAKYVAMTQGIEGRLQALEEQHNITQPPLIPLLEPKRREE